MSPLAWIGLGFVLGMIVALGGVACALGAILPPPKRRKP